MFTSDRGTHAAASSSASRVVSPTHDPAAAPEASTGAERDVSTAYRDTASPEVLTAAMRAITTAIRAATPVALAALLAFASAACGGDDSADDAGDMPPIPGAEAAGDGADRQIATVYAPDLGVDIERMAALPSGLHMRDLEVGSGELAVTGRTVRVIYTGWLPNGVEFDSNKDGQPMAFVLGVGDAMAGWEEGISGMRAGGRRSLVIPPALGYGERGLPGVIPPNSTLIYDIRLEEVILPDTTSSGQ